MELNFYWKLFDPPAMQGTSGQGGLGIVMKNPLSIEGHENDLS